MTQPGHATDIYSDSTNPRYQDTGTLRTTFAGAENRPGKDTYNVEQFELGDGTITDFYVKAPCGGKLSRLEITSLTTTDGSNKIQLVGTNESNSDAAMFTQLWDDDPVATADTAAAGTLSTTAANLLVDQGDLIKIVYTETGTIAGGVVSLYFENF